MDKKLTKQSNKLAYIDKKFTNKINLLDAKIIGRTGELNIKLDNMQKDIKHLKENPFVVESRLSSLEQDHLELLSLIGKTQTNQA